MNDARITLTPLLFIMPIAGLTYYLSHFQPSPVYHLAIAAILFFWSLVSIRNASIAFLTMMIIIDDFPRLYSDDLLIEMPFSSLFTVQIGDMTVYLLLAIYFIILLTGTALKQEKNISGRSLTISDLSPEIKVIITFGFISAFVGLLNIASSFRMYVSDSGLFINIFLGYLIVRMFRWDEFNLKRIFILIVFSVSAKIILVVLDAVIFSRSLGLVTIKPGTDSYLAIIVILFGVTLMGRGAGASASVKAFFMTMVILTISYYFVTASRGRVLIGAITFLIFLFELKATRSMLLIAASVIAVGIAQLLVPPEYLSYFAWKSGTFAASETEGMSSLVRVISLQNIISQQFDTVYQLFTGTGLGGYFTSQYYPFPFDLTGGDAFQDDWIAADTFYKPHGSTLIILLKTGMLGFLVIYGSIAWGTVKNAFLARTLRRSSEVSRMFMVVSPCILPLMTVSFSSKLQLVTGALFGLSYFSSKILLNERALEIDQMKVRRSSAV